MSDRHFSLLFAQACEIFADCKRILDHSLRRSVEGGVEIAVDGRSVQRNNSAYVTRKQTCVRHGGFGTKRVTNQSDLVESLLFEVLVQICG